MSPERKPGCPKAILAFHLTLSGGHPPSFRSMHACREHRGARRRPPRREHDGPGREHEDPGREHDGPGRKNEGPGREHDGPGLTLFMYSLSRSWSACRTALHSATILSRRSSRVHEESAMSAAPLMMLSSLSSRDGRNLASLNVMGSRMILFWKECNNGGETKSAENRQLTAFAPSSLNQDYPRPGQDSLSVDKKPVYLDKCLTKWPWQSISFLEASVP